MRKATTPLVRRAIVASTIVAAAVTLTGQQGDQPQTPTFRAGVDAVQIDAFVTDADGRPVSGLTADDFEVFRNNQTQPITTFATVNIPAVKAPLSAIVDEPDVLTNSAPDGRIYLFMLTSMSPDMALRTRHLLHRFMDLYFGEHDIASVVVEQGLVTDGQDFTGNRRLILQAIDKWGGSFGASTSVDTRSSVQDLRDRMEFFARIPGHRKFVLWFTDAIGFDAYDVVDYNGGVPSLGGEHVHAAMAAATRGNIRIYPISPRGLDGELGEPELRRVAEFRAVAAVTGGAAQVASNDFDGAFAHLIQETSHYYVLGVEAAAVKQGRYVKFDVKVKRPGLQVKARPGYVEQLEYVRRKTKPAPTRTPVELALANPIAVPGVPMRVVATPFKGEGRRATVALTVELDPSSLAFTEKNGRAFADLQLRHLATSARKDIFPEWRYAGSVEADSVDRDRLRAHGLRVVSQLDVPEGRYQIRVASASGEQFGSLVYDLDVPDFRDGDLAMSGVVLTTARSDQTVTMKRETARSGVSVSRWDSTTGSPVLQMLQQLPTPPTTERTFTPNDTLGLFVEVYDNNKRIEKDGEYSIHVTASLLDSAGSLVRRVSERQASTAVRRPSGGHGFSLSLPLTYVSAGDYVIQVETRSERNPQNRVTRRVPVRVSTSGTALLRGTS